MAINNEMAVYKSNRSYFDEHVYAELKACICKTTLSSDKESSFAELPSFEDLMEKINSFVLRRDLRTKIITETLSRLLNELDKNSGKQSFLITYLCRETIKNCVLRKFNAVLGCECTDLLELSHKIGDNVYEANKMFLSIRICDPSVGSGVFLSTMLNEMIAVKSQLGILSDKRGNPMYQYKFIAVDGGLVVLDKKEFDTVDLDDATQKSAHIQEALYEEKVALIGNCLFGIDMEPLSALLCKLRLWLSAISSIGASKAGNLPFVEGNIICGNALVSRFTLKDDLLAALKNINHTVLDYKSLAEKIKTIKDSSDRNYLKELITLIKNRLVEGIGRYSEDTDELLHLRRKLSEMTAPSLFQLNDKEAQMYNDRILLLRSEIKKQETYRQHTAFDNAVEWRYVFPELLDDKGDFTCFDAFIGMLPDASVAGMGGDASSLYKRMNYKVFRRNGNVGDMFCELANRLLVYKGCMAFIMSSEWRHESSNSKIGEFIFAEMNPLQLILPDDLSTSYDMLKNKCAVIIQKDFNRHNTVSCRIDASYNPDDADIDAYIRKYATPIFRLIDNVKVGEDMSVAGAIASNAEYVGISRKIKKLGLLIKDWDVGINAGIMTGCDEAFIIDKAMKDELIHVDYKNSDIIKPLLTGDSIKRYGDGVPERWLLCIPWHFPLQFDKTIKAASTRAEQRFMKQYPDVYNHLLKYKQQLFARSDIEVGFGFEWYALQRLGNSLDDFAKQKLVWKLDSADFDFGIDYGDCAVLDDACFMVGHRLKYLMGVFNSTMGRFMLSDLSGLSSSESNADVSVIESMSVPMPSGKVESEIISLVNRRISENSKDEAGKRMTEEKIDKLIFDLYELTGDEIAFIKAQTG
ncbi:MAG: hypothetical protein LBT42_03095 [Tannerella sp.]|nr:hypothetical protein [Tannerella sp.]